MKWFRLFILMLFMPAPVSLAVADVKQSVRSQAPNGLVLVLDEKGKPLLSQNADKAFVPASVAKIATAWFAMEVLGQDPRLEQS